MPTITGTPSGTNTVAAQCTSPASGADLQQSSTASPLQSVENDIATLDQKMLQKAGGVMTGTLTMEANILMDTGYDIDVKATSKVQIEPGAKVRLDDETALIALGASGFSRTRALAGRWVIETNGDYSPADWSEGITGILTGLTSTVDLSADDSTTVPKACFVLSAPLPLACTITRVKVWIRGNSTGRTFTPTGLPFFYLNIIDATGVAGDSTTGPYTDATPSHSSSGPDLAAYDSAHAIDSGALSIAYDATKHRIVLKNVSNEYGTGSILSLQILGATITYTQTQL